MHLVDRKKHIFFPGSWHPANGEEIAVADPSTNSLLSTVRSSILSDVAGAVDAAADAFPAWKCLSISERPGFLKGFSRGLEARHDQFCEIQMRNSGKLRVEAEAISDAIATFEYYAKFSDSLDAGQDVVVNQLGDDHQGLVRHEPVGPVGLIVPWSFPLVTAAWKIGPTLAASCTAVLKMSEVTPLADMVYGDIAEEIGLPAGVLNILTGLAYTGAALTSATKLRKISFMGSNAVAEKVLVSWAPRCLPVSLKLGRKSALIVTAKADFYHAVQCIIGAVFFNVGQICSATSRLVVDEKIEPFLMDALVKKTEALIVGPPSSDSSEMFQ